MSRSRGRIATASGLGRLASHAPTSVCSGGAAARHERHVCPLCDGARHQHRQSEPSEIAKPSGGVARCVASCSPARSPRACKARTSPGPRSAPGHESLETRRRTDAARHRAVEPIGAKRQHESQSGQGDHRYDRCARVPSPCRARRQAPPGPIRMKPGNSSRSGPCARPRARSAASSSSRRRRMSGAPVDEVAGRNLQIAARVGRVAAGLEEVSAKAFALPTRQYTSATGATRMTLDGRGGMRVVQQDCCASGPSTPASARRPTTSARPPITPQYTDDSACSPVTMPRATTSRRRRPAPRRCRHRNVSGRK